MNLFVLREGVLEIDDMAYGLIPFRRLLDRDKTEGKEIATAEILYLYFMYDLRSDFRDQYNNEIERSQAVMEEVHGLPDNWKPDSFVKVAGDFYESRKSLLHQLLDDAESAVRNVSKYLVSADLFE